MSNSNPFAELIALLESAFKTRYTIDPPLNAEGEWWLDVSLDGWSTSVAWRPNLGFGLFTSEAALGERPDEIFTDARKASDRLRQIARRQAAHEAPTMTLKDVRLLVGQTQKEVAELLSTGQAEISRLEGRGDMHVDRFKSYVEALGGKLEVTVTFPDFRGPIAFPSAGALPRP